MDMDEASRLWKLFDEQFENDDYEKAEETIDSLIEYFREKPNTNNYAYSLQRKAMLCEQVGRGPEALAYNGQAFSLSLSDNLKVLPVIALNSSLMYERAGMMDEALSVLLETAKGKRALSEELIHLYFRILDLSANQSETEGILDSTFDNYERKERLAIIQGIANYMYEKEDFPKALKYFELVEDPDNTETDNFAFYHSIGICHSKLGNIRKAIGNLQRAGIIALKEEDLYAVSLVNLNLSIAYAEDNQLKAAGARLSDSYTLAKQNGFDDIVRQIDRMIADGKVNLEPNGE